jgi:hypothetical protein
MEDAFAAVAELCALASKALRNKKAMARERVIRY